MKKPSQNELLRAAIDDSGWTVTEVAERAGYARGYKEIYPYLTGERAMGPRVRERLARALLLAPDAFDPLRPAAIAMRAYLSTPAGKSTTAREREAIRRILPCLSAPSADTFRLLIFAIRTDAPTPTQGRRLHEPHKRGNT